MAEKTIVKGVRATEQFYATCDKVARIKKISRNELITNIVKDYCDYQLYLYNKSKSVDSNDIK